MYIDSLAKENEFLDGKKLVYIMLVNLFYIKLIKGSTVLYFELTTQNKYF